MGKRLGRLIWVAALALALRACVLEPVRITDDSMQPRLLDGDVALVSKLRYGLRVPGAGALLLEWATPSVGDLVVSVAIGDPPVNVLRRITAVPGDKVTMPDGKEATLKEGEFWLAAEQNEGVMDSRKMGPVPRKSIVGKATYVWLAKRPSAHGGSQVESQQPERSAGWRFLQPL
jgi:signal peptidase I